MKNQIAKIQIKNKKVFVYFVLLCIIILGSFLRLQGVFTNSFAFTYDVGRDMLALQNIVTTHKIPLIGFTTGLPGVFYGPWWYIILLIPFILVGGNPQGVSFFIALTGIISIPIGFYIGKRIANEFLGLIIAVFVAVSPQMVSITAQIWNPNLAPLFVLLVFLVLTILFRQEFKKTTREKSRHAVNKIWSGNSLLLYLILGILLGLIIDSEIVFGFLFLVSMVFVCIFLLRKQVSLSKIITTILGIFIIFSPRIVFEFRHQFLMTNTMSAALTSNTPHTPTLIFPTLIQRIVFFYSIFLSTLANANQFLGVAMLVFAVCTYIFFWRRMMGLLKKVLIANIIILSVYLLGLTLFSHDIWPHYTVGIPVIYIFIFSTALWLWYSVGKQWIVLLVLFLLFWINLQPIQLIANLQKPLWQGDASVYRNQLAVVNYVYRQAHKKQFKYIVYTPPVFDYPYQYLFSWYGKRTYGYIPSNQANLFFVIIEPDPSEPFRRINWLKTRENDGKIVKDVTLTGGIEVQTRITK